MKRKVIFWIAIILLLGIFCYAAFSLGSYAIASFQSQKLYNGLQSSVDALRPTRPPITEPTTPKDPTAPSDETPPETTVPTEAPTEPTPLPTEPPYVEITDPSTGEKRQVLPEFASLYLQNDDLVGWIEIENTSIAYPVMQTPDNPNYYLKKSFNHRFNERGCIYVKEDCDVFAPSDNVVIYGHHFEDGSMFSPLLNYKDRDYAKAHRYIYFDTLFERHTYEVVVVFGTVANASSTFPYHRFVDASSEAEFNEFLSTAASMSYYDGASAVYGDKLITLSTCDFMMSDGRLVVVAKRVA